MSCIQQNFPSKFEPNDAFYEKLEENTFVAFILKHPVYNAHKKEEEFFVLPKEEIYNVFYSKQKHFIALGTS